jgi:hypothetical protein
MVENSGHNLLIGLLSAPDSTWKCFGAGQGEVVIWTKEI